MVITEGRGSGKPCVAVKPAAPARRQGKAWRRCPPARSQVSTLQLQLYTQDAAGSRDTSLKRQARNGSTSARALPESKAYYCRYTARTEVCRSPGAVSSVHGYWNWLSGDGMASAMRKKGTASLPEAMSRPIPWATLLGHRRPRPSRRHS